MRNRAKCNLCKYVIESFHCHDFVECKCKEIHVDGGPDFFRAGANDWKNFIRIDEDGNEIPIKIQIVPDSEMPQVMHAPSANDQYAVKEPTRDDLLMMLKDAIDVYEKLPQSAMHHPVTHYDLLNAMMIIYAVLKKGS